MNPTLVYLYFADQLDLVRLRNQLTPKECDIVRIIAKSHLANGNTRASQLLEMEYLGSPSTIHSTIKRLVSKKMVLTSVDAIDNRIKYLVPAPKALSLLNELGQLINSLLVNSSAEIADNAANPYSVMEIESLSIMNAG